MSLNWLRKNWERIKDRGCACGCVLFASVCLLLVGIGVWSVFIGEPRKKAEEKEARRQGEQRGRELRLELAGATWIDFPGRTDRIGLDALDPATIPAAERYPWQPE